MLNVHRLVYIEMTHKMAKDIRYLTPLINDVDNEEQERSFWEASLLWDFIFPFDSFLWSGS